MKFLQKLGHCFGVVLKRGVEVLIRNFVFLEGIPLVQYHFTSGASQSQGLDLLFTIQRVGHLVSFG